METVKNVAEAEKFFLDHSEGEVICQNDNGLTKVVSNFPDAEVFFGGEAEVAAEEAAADASEAAAGDAGADHGMVAEGSNEATTVTEGAGGQIAGDAGQSAGADVEAAG